MGKVFIKRTFGLKSIDQVKAHAKYVGFRSQEKSERGFFDREADNSDYLKFIERIEDNKALKHPNAVKAHKLIFSLRGVDYEAYKRSGLDYKDLIRKTLGEYEKKHGVKLDWIANIHEKEGHPHTHVIIKAVSDMKDSEGRSKRIKFTKDDFKEMKEIFDKEFEKDVQYKDTEKFDADKTLKDISQGFEQVIKNISRDIDKEQATAEQLRDKVVKTEVERSRANSREDR